MAYAKFSRKWVLGLVCVLCIWGGGFAAGLPGEFLVTQRWRALHNPYSSLSNPANLAEENYTSVRGAIAPVLGGAFNLFELGVNMPLSLYHTASFTALIESGGSVYGNIPDDAGKLVEDLSNALGNSNLVFSFGYAWHFWQSLILGANLNFAYQTNFGDPLMGTGIDFGATYRLMKHPVLGEHIIGMATQNLIAPTMGSSFVPDFGSAGEYARNLRLQGYSKFWENRLENFLEFDIKDFVAGANNFSGDVSFFKKLEWDLNWRIGFWAMRMFKAHLLLGFNESVIGHWGFALGAQIPSFNAGRDLSAHYQYNIMTEDESDATSHTFYVKADFGKHREEKFARNFARVAGLNPSELYNRARKMYSEGKYWEAFFLLSRVVVEFPDFFRNDWVSLLRADCQEQLDMRDQAVKNYEKVKEDYPTGEVAPYADLGLMRIYYRNGDFPQATNQFVELNKPSVPDSLRFHGTYIMGQIFLQNGELRKAIHTLAIIPETHPDYIFAQHAIAIAHATLGSDMKEVITALENAISIPPKTAEQQEIVNRSYLFMGLIFYEESALSKAVVALRSVPQTSYFSEDALLGLGWTALKARQWNDCISTGQQLVRITQKPILRCEGMLIQAYGYLLQKDYPRALELLRTSYELSKTLQAPSVDSLNMRSLQNDNNRIAYSQMSDRVEDFSQIGQTSHITGVLDSLKNQSNNFIKSFQDHHRFQGEFQRSTFFSRNIDQVQDDLEYALATVQKIAGVSSGGDRDRQRLQEESKDLEAEIEKLRREMEGLE
ncbi:MAG: tetratricopeptide repeat protein [Chitinispirillales bacterium]|jgi:tetratricopeptide (TPR) repeat protein|nr:tetratricopeptide repeat protein [Chitinispirillales bacterium]